MGWYNSSVSWSTDKVWSISSTPNGCSKVWKTLRWNHNENFSVESNVYLYILWRWCISLVKQPVHFVSNVQVDRRPSLDAIHFALIFCWVSQLPKEKTCTSIKVIDSGTSFIKGKQNSNQFKLRSFHSCLPKILLGPSLNTFPQIISPSLTHFRSTFPFCTP